MAWNEMRAGRERTDEQLPHLWYLARSPGWHSHGGRVCVFTLVIINVTVSLFSYTFLHYTKVYKVSFIIAGLFLIADGGPLILFIDSMSSTGAIYGCMVFVAVGAVLGCRW